MRPLLGRKLNRMAMYGALLLAIVVNSAGSSQGWWPASIWAVLPMLAAGLGAGWLMGSKVKGTAA
ncbi:hypothetical protein [Brevundimonas kwangchunensis]